MSVCVCLKVCTVCVCELVSECVCLIVCVCMCLKVCTVCVCELVSECVFLCVRERKRERERVSVKKLVPISIPLSLLSM